MKLSVLIALLFLGASAPAAAQVAVTYFPFQSVLGVSSDTERRVWGGLNVEANTFISNLNLEPHAMLNLRRGEVANYYGGLGTSLNLFAAASNLPLLNGYALTAGTRIKPLPKCRGVQVVFELAPYLNRHLDSGYLRAMLGVSYTFHRPD